MGAASLTFWGRGSWGAGPIGGWPTGYGGAAVPAPKPGGCCAWSWGQGAKKGGAHATLTNKAGRELPVAVLDPSGMVWEAAGALPEVQEQAFGGDGITVGVPEPRGSEIASGATLPGPQGAECQRMCFRRPARPRGSGSRR